MQIKLICKNCGIEYEVPHWRCKISHYCSRRCSDNSHRGKNNVKCTFCGKEFHLKPYQINSTPRTRGVYCSRTCQHQDLKTKSLGELNHQYNLRGHLNASFKGAETTRKNGNLIEIKVYSPNHPFGDKNSRVLKHRLVVEHNYQLFDITKFVLINGNYYLPTNLYIHHIDGNHDNNDVRNLQIVTRSEHTTIHNKEKKIIRNNSGKIIGVIKLDKLLGTPEEDNQQPS